MRRANILLVTLALGLVACDPTIWDALEDDTPVYVIGSPGGRNPGAFGTLLVGYEATVRGAQVSRIAVGGGFGTGAGSSFYSFYGFEGTGPTAVPRFDEAAAFVGCDMDECTDGHGASIAAFPEWRGPGGALFHGCLAAPAPTSGQIQVRCEDQLPQYQTVAAPTGESFGVSGAGIAFPQHRAGVALFGAPAALSGSGALYRLPNGGAGPIRVDLSAAMAPPGGAVGTQVAVTVLSERAIAFATRAAYPGDVQRVIVGTLDIDDLEVTTVELHACLEGARGFGGALAWGDLDGDGVDDLAIGSTEEALAQRIAIYDGNDLTTVHTCADAVQPEPVTTIACEDVVAGTDVTCTMQIGFGFSLAIGDVDADGTNDLVAGAPSASPRGRLAGGAVVVMAGEPASLAMIGRRSSVLFQSSLGAGDRLGTSVATFRGQDRAEIAAGAPGGLEVVVFLCSGIAGDRPEDLEGARGCLQGM